MRSPSIENLSTTLIAMENDQPILLGHHLLAHVWALSRDRERIAEREAAEQAWQRSEAILAATLESINEGVLVVSEDGRVSHCNSRFREIWSIPQDLLVQGDDRALIDRAKDRLTDPEAPPPDLS